MEGAGEAAALADPLLTEPFQNAYDGGLWVWGVPSADQVNAGQLSTWIAAAADREPAAARFQVGAVGLDLALPARQQFDLARLPIPPLEDPARLEDQLELVAVQLEGVTARPGEVVSLALYWQALAAPDTSYTVFVQALSGEDKAGQVDRLPCDGGCPTNTWRPGNLVGERYDLPIRADAAPGRYQLITGMYDLETGDNLNWYDAQGNAVGITLPIGTLEVQP
jgi:hypothetical protein